MSDLSTLNPDQLLTAKELAPLLRVRPKRVYELSIPCVRLTRRSYRWRIRDVQAWMASRTEAERI